MGVTRAPRERVRVATARPDEGVWYVLSAPGIVSWKDGVVPVDPVWVSGVDDRPRSYSKSAFWIFGWSQGSTANT